MAKFIFEAILTPEEEGGYSATVPALPGCFSDGETYRETIFMIADAMKTWIASALHHGEVISPYRREKVPEGCERAVIFVETDETYVVEGPFMSAAAAARELGVSAGRITRMLDSGILDGYRSGRRTFIIQESVSRRKQQPHRPGRPRKALEA